MDQTQHLRKAEEQETDPSNQFTRLPSKTLNPEIPTKPSNLVRQRSTLNESKKSALHFALKENPQPTTSHSEMLPNHHHGETVVMVKYIVFWINKKENDKTYQLHIEWPHVEIVFEAIRDVIPYINQKLAESGSAYILSPDPTLYEFFKAKKSGKPKVDYPGLDVNQTLSMTGIQHLTLVEKTPEAIQLRTDIFQEGDGEFKVDGTKDIKSTMVRSTMPGVASMVSWKNEEEEEFEEKIETFCFCFKVKRKTKKINAEDKGKSELEQKLIH